MELAFEELQKEYETLKKLLISTEDKMSDIYTKFWNEYINKILEDNKGNFALCPGCDRPLEIIQKGYAKCECGIKIFVKRHTDTYEEYIVYHNFPNIKNVIVGINKNDPKLLIPPEVFSVVVYNTVIRPQIMDILRNYGIVDLELELK